VCAAARKLGVASYLDGARLLNAAVATGTPARTLAAPFDLAAIALSKGLGCPVGTVLAGRKDDIVRAARYRRMLGGSMRQCGIIAAAGLYALDNNVERMAEDHANTRLIAERLAQSPRIKLDIATVQTNILVFHVTDAAPDAPTVVARAKEKGVLLSAFAPRMLRLVTHLDVSRTQSATAADVIAKAIDG